MKQRSARDLEVPVSTWNDWPTLEAAYGRGLALAAVSYVVLTLLGCGFFGIVGSPFDWPELARQWLLYPPWMVLAILAGFAAGSILYYRRALIPIAMIVVASVFLAQVGASSRLPENHAMEQADSVAKARVTLLIALTPCLLAVERIVRPRRRHESV